MTTQKPKVNTEDIKIFLDKNKHNTILLCVKKNGRSDYSEILEVNEGSLWKTAHRLVNFYVIEHAAEKVMSRWIAEDDTRWIEAVLHMSDNRLAEQTELLAINTNDIDAGDIDESEIYDRTVDTYSIRNPF